MSFDGYRYHRIERVAAFGGLEVWIADGHAFVNQGFDELELDDRQIDGTIAALRLARKAMGEVDHERKQERADFHARKIIARIADRCGWYLRDRERRRAADVSVRERSGMQGGKRGLGERRERPDELQHLQERNEDRDGHDGAIEHDPGE